tara:strand:- start:552 stop:824 length:273 start_codon:yes stop_codon:yes gene_type:complete
MISLEEYLGHKIDLDLERATRTWLIDHPKYNTFEHHSIVDTNENDSLYQLFKIPKKILYSREFLDECYSNKNSNWVDGSLKRQIEECKKL